VEGFAVLALVAAVLLLVGAGWLYFLAGLAVVVGGWLPAGVLMVVLATSVKPRRWTVPLTVVWVPVYAALWSALYVLVPVLVLAQATSGGVAALFAGLPDLGWLAALNRLADRLWAAWGLVAHPAALRMVEMWAEGNAAVAAIGLAVCVVLAVADAVVAAWAQRRTGRPARRAAPLETLWSTDAAAAWTAVQARRAADERG